MYQCSGSSVIKGSEWLECTGVNIEGEGMVKEARNQGPVVPLVDIKYFK